MQLYYLPQFLQKHLSKTYFIQASLQNTLCKRVLGNVDNYLSKP